MKIRPVGAGLLHPDGQTDERTDRPTDMAKLTVTFRKFANAPKTEDHLIQTSAICQYHLILEPLVEWRSLQQSSSFVENKKLGKPMMINSRTEVQARKIRMSKFY
jgi:hypothetical protein